MGQDSRWGGVKGKGGGDQKREWGDTLWCVFFFKQKTAYEIGTGDWSSDVCSSGLHHITHTFEDFDLAAELERTVRSGAHREYTVKHEDRKSVV